MFAIGQRAVLIQTSAGNVLWDCLALIDDATAAAVRERGGLAAIAISHPHDYTTMVEWSDAFGGVPIYLHEDDRQWVVRPAPAVQYWGGERMPLHDGLTLVRGGGHFSGGTMLHWPAGAEGRGVLFTGDIIQVVMDRRWGSFMYSYPLGGAAVRRVVASIADLQFDRIHGAFRPRSVMFGREGRGPHVPRSVTSAPSSHSRELPGVPARCAHSRTRRMLLDARRRIAAVRSRHTIQRSPED